MSYHIYSFEKLQVYQDSLDYSVRIRATLTKFPKEEQFDLCRQLKRSTESIGANLAEGSGRSSNVDQAHFTNMAYSSALETINHLNVALRLNFLEKDIYTELRLDIDRIINQLNGLYKYQLNNNQNLKSKLKG
ncbi:four helix bundle protein [Parapedobacter sp. SGR-10]|uniref:four helix bundle protein n=1 Tax=Parapedobacter sp. SGR-10 TaxID=2710879 RepID=UPI0013D86630|nr:four helix bundle protein [Parapedobacter sp. SGR-10]NGF58303.1 four helix bundle protein [Parapedobacter sp. SGR-10]